MEAAKTALVEMTSAKTSGARSIGANPEAAKTTSLAAAMEVRFADGGKAHGEKRSKTKGC